MDFPSVKRAWIMKIDFTSLQAKINVDLKMQNKKKVLVLRGSY